MSRAAQGQAQQTYNQSKDLTTGSTANSSDLYNTLMPTYTQEATNPQGFGSSDLASMNTAAQQSTGGALASAVGQGARSAAANRNAGSFAPALDESARAAGRTLSSDALGIQNANAGLKQSQRQQGIQGLQGLQNQQNGDILSSLGLQNQSTNTLINAGNSGWFQNMLGLINAVKGVPTPSAGGSGGGGGSTDYGGGSEGDELSAAAG